MKGQREGAVYGTMYDNALLVLGLSVNTVDSGATPYQEMQTHFPTEVDFCGLVIFTDDTDDHQLSPTTLDILKVLAKTLRLKNYFFYRSLVCFALFKSKDSIYHYWLILLYL